MRIFDKSSLALKYTCYCSKYLILNDYLSVDSSEFYPDISSNEWKQMFIDAEKYTDDLVIASTVTENIPNEVAVLYMGIIESFDEEKFINTKHFLKMFDSVSAPADQYIKGSVPSGQLADGTKLGSIQMQLAHIFLAPVLHGFGYNCWEGLADLVKNKGGEIDSKYSIGYNQNASSIIRNQQLCLFEWEQDADPLGPDLSKIGDLKYSSGLWTPLGGALITSKKNDREGIRKEITVKVRNMPSGATDKTNETTSKWWDNEYSVTTASIIEYIKRACVEYGVVITPSMYYSNSKFVGIAKQNGSKIRDDIYKVDAPNQNYGNTALQKTDFALTFSVGPFTDPARSSNEYHFMNSVALVNPNRARYVKLTLTDKSSVVKSIDMDFKTERPNICFVYMDESNDKETYFRERVFGPDIIVFKLSSGKYYKVMSGDYADMIRYGGGTYYRNVYNVWPSDWRAFDQRIPANVDTPYNFISLISSSSFQTSQYENFNNPFSGPSSTTVVWGNNWLDYFGCPEIFEEYTKVIDDLSDAPDRLQRFKDAAANWHGEISVEGVITDYENWAENIKIPEVAEMNGQTGVATWSDQTIRDSHVHFFFNVYIMYREALHGIIGDYDRWDYIYTGPNINSNRPYVYICQAGYLWATIFYALDSVMRWPSGWEEYHHYNESYMVAYRYISEASWIEGEPKSWFDYWTNRFSDWYRIFTYEASIRAGQVDWWYNRVVQMLNEAEGILRSDDHYDFLVGYLYNKAFYISSMAERNFARDAENHWRYDRVVIDDVHPEFKSKAESVATEWRNKELDLLKQIREQVVTLKEAASPALDNVTYYTSAFCDAIPDDHPSVSDGNQTYSEKRYTDVEAKSEELGNRLRQLDYEFSEAVKEMSRSDKDDVEVTVEVYNNANWNPLDLRVGMYGDISYKGKTYENLILTSIEVDSTKYTHKLKFGAKRSTFYATFERK